MWEEMGIGMVGNAAGKFLDVGIEGLREGLFGDYYRGKQLEQSQALLDQQMAGQKELMNKAQQHQINTWNATNASNQVKHMESAGLNPALMYGGSGGGGATAGSSSGQAAPNAAGNQQLIDNTNKTDMAQMMVAVAQADKLKAEADNLRGDTAKKEQETLKLKEEQDKIKKEVLKIEGETALLGWKEREVMTISDSELQSYSEGAGWNKGWSEGTSQGTSKGEGKQGGMNFGTDVGVKVLGTGTDIGLNAGVNYGYNESESQNTSESKSENAGANTSKSSTKSTSGSRDVLVWPEYSKDGKLKNILMVILTGDYQNIRSEFRVD